MNKTIAMLILGVILLAMGLIMVNQYVNQPADKASSPSATAPAAPKAEIPQAASPADAIQQLQQRAASSELAGKAPAKPVMPAWASNAPQQPKAEAAPPATRPEPPQAVTEKPAPKQEAPKAETARAEAKAEPSQATSAQAATDKPAPAKVEAAKPEKKAEAPKPKPKGPKTIKKITVSTVDDAVNVRVEASEDPQYKTMLLKSPDRLVVDLEGQWAIKAPGVPTNKYVSNVRIGKQGDKTRIVIDLRQNPASVRYVKRGNEGFDIRMK